ncbi:MAG: tripartite tricarboxylate transporter TctB family protein [Deltaproteobacteria bacterium]|nr:tripartite tricarboxylate transporter TctB family protein [Deltaproteobacteria bacterium]
MALVFAWALWQGRDWLFRTRLFPWAIGIPGLALVFMQLVLDVSGLFKGRGAGLAERRDERAALVRRRTTAISGWIIGYFLTLWLLGFSLGVLLMTFLYLKLAGREPWSITLALTLFAWISFYGIFGYGLHVPFPKGLLLQWLGV